MHCRKWENCHHQELRILVFLTQTCLWTTFSKTCLPNDGYMDWHVLHRVGQSWKTWDKWTKLPFLPCSATQGKLMWECWWGGSCLWFRRSNADSILVSHSGPTVYPTRMGSQEFAHDYKQEEYEVTSGGTAGVWGTKAVIRLLAIIFLYSWK